MDADSRHEIPASTHPSEHQDLELALVVLTPEVFCMGLSWKQRGPREMGHMQWTCSTTVEPEFRVAHVFVKS